jgi:2-haloacid dehalogenase
VAPGLDLLHEAGFTTAALTNSPQATAETQLAHAGIADRFNRIMSVEMVDRFKPHRSVYEAAARSLGVSASEVTMVAAHDWDVTGAIASGCEGVFITRAGQIYSSAFPEPTLIAVDIEHAAHLIIDYYS